MWQLQGHWNLSKEVIVDEMMICYKGKYRPACQYMPKKPQKWRIKIWCIADAVFKYMHDFDIYCRASQHSLDYEGGKKFEGGQ